MFKQNEQDQINFHDSDDNKEIIIASSRSIKSSRGENEIFHKSIEESRNIEKIRTVIEKLPKPVEKELSELDLNTISKKSVIKILDTTPQESDRQSIENVLHDFSDSMKKRAREEGKYAVAITLNNGFIVCHSTIGEETITPDWQIIPRMLDSDNVLRYIYFQKKEKKIIAKFFEKFASDGFVDWLGLKSRDAFSHFGGRYRFFSKLEDKVTAVIEISEDDIDDWIDDHDEEILDGKIQFHTPITSLSLTQILVGRKKYTKTEDFIQDYQGEKIGIDRYKKVFSDLYSIQRQQKSIGPMDLYLHKFIDEKEKLIKIVDGEHITICDKENPNVDIIFCCDKIEFRSSYLDDILTRFNNGVEILIVHPGMSIAARSLRIKNLRVANQLNTNSTIKFLIKYYADTQLQDKWLDSIFTATIFSQLAQANNQNCLKYFFNNFAQKIIKDAKLVKKLTKIEDDIFEYKSSDKISGDNKTVIKNIAEIIEQKANNSQCKLIFFGIEKDGTFNPILNKKFYDDRIGDIAKALKELTNRKISIIPIRDDTKCVPLVIVEK